LGKEEREMAVAFEKGRAILEAENVSSFLDGKDVGREECARAMLDEGDPPEKVVRCTGLSLEQVKALM
jgi:hypothetical protein